MSIECDRGKLENCSHAFNFMLVYMLLVQDKIGTKQKINLNVCSVSNEISKAMPRIGQSPYPQNFLFNSEHKRFIIIRIEVAHLYCRLFLFPNSFALIVKEFYLDIGV